MHKKLTRIASASSKDYDVLSKMITSVRDVE